jgi:hypothetical protein
VSGQYGGTGRGVSGQYGGTGRGVSGQYGGPARKRGRRNRASVTPTRPDGRFHSDTRPQAPLHHSVTWLTHLVAQSVTTAPEASRECSTCAALTFQST